MPRARRGALVACGVVLGSLAAWVPTSGHAATEIGIDVSSYQHTINWNAVAGSGISFAYIKASEGCCATDGYFQSNWSGARAAGVTPGAYLFFHPGDDPTAQATLFLQQLQAAGFHEGDLVPAIDVEVTDGLPPAAIVSALRALVDQVQAAIGVLPALYTAPLWWDAHVASSQFTADPLWVADWCGCGSPTLPAGGWGGRGYQAWQYTDSTPVPGISGNVDGDAGNAAPPIYPGSATLSQPQRLLSGGLSGNPQAVTVSPGVSEVVWRGTDARLGVLVDNNGTTARLLTGSLPANMASDPAAVALPNGTVDVFWQSTGDELWMASSASRYRAQDLGIGGLASAPHAAASPGGLVAVTWTGSDGTLWNTVLSGAARTRPASTGDGGLASAPYPVYIDGARLAVFWRGADAALWWDVNSGAGWQGEQSLGNGPLASDPQPIPLEAGSISVFWLGGDGIAWQLSYSAGGWLSAGAVSGSGVASAPAALSPSPGSLAVFVRDSNNALWASGYSGRAGWSEPIVVAANTAGSQPAAAAASGGAYDVFWRAADGSLQHITH